ncbi:MAG: hypothetical protein QNJ68_10405 [Microcoleaceae cyanobacterium MO_207.B10]|nr:hypothetical protein [Microcoleaceae cyanobacterium MO_207.B10]
MIEIEQEKIEQGLSILIEFHLDDSGENSFEKWFEIGDDFKNLKEEINSHFSKYWYIKESVGFSDLPFDELELSIHKVFKLASYIREVGSHLTEPLCLFYLHLLETEESFSKFTDNFKSSYFGKFDSKEECLLEYFEREGVLTKFLQLQLDFVIEYLDLEEMISDGWFDERFICLYSGSLTGEGEKENLHFFKTK